MSHERHWYEDHSELVAFARAISTSFDWDAATLLHLFENPWRWTDEYIRWVADGRPAEARDHLEEVAND